MLTSLNAPDLPRTSTHTPEPSALSEVLSLIEALEAAARAEGRSMAGSNAADVLPLAEAFEHTNHARDAITRAVTTLAQGGAR